VSPEIVLLAEERQQYWGQLKELAGVAPAPAVRDRLAESLQADFDRRADTLRSEYEGKLADLHASYPRAVARRLAEALLRGDGGTRSIKDLVTLATQSDNGRARSAGNLANAPTLVAPPVASPPPRAPAVVAQPAAKASPATAVVESDEAIAIEPYIDTARCTTCNECTNLNARMFAYDANKQATIKDRQAGTFQQLVVAAERCPVGIIHPGTPLNPKEKDLAKWVKRAAPFN
jgi:ferredoxin